MRRAIYLSASTTVSGTALFRRTRGSCWVLGRTRTVAGYLRNLNGESFIRYLDTIGWAQDGAFTILLSTMGYHFDEKGGRMGIRRGTHLAEYFLSLLISEL